MPTLKKDSEDKPISQIIATKAFNAITDAIFVKIRNQEV